MYEAGVSNTPHLDKAAGIIKEYARFGPALFLSATLSWVTSAAKIHNTGIQLLTSGQFDPILVWKRMAGLQPLPPESTPIKPKEENLALGWEED